MSSERGPHPIGPGAVVLIVGPSGAGKDALIDGSRARLAADATFVFPKRIVTRPAHAAEAHIPMDVSAFIAAERSGAFALTWAAHGLGYGIPIGIDQDVRAGRVVIANVSRGIVEQARQRYAYAPVVLIDCPLAVRTERLAARGRETIRDVATRLCRTVDGFDRSAIAFEVDNGGTLEAGVAKLVKVLKSIAAAAAKSA